MTAPAAPVHRRTHLLDLLHEEHRASGWLSRDAVASVAARAGIPAAEAWEAATSYPDFRFQRPSGATPVCTGLSCRLSGATAGPGEAGVGCRFRCYDAPAPGLDAAFLEERIILAGPLMAPDVDDWRGLDAARGMTREGALALLDESGLRGRGGAYFRAGLKWSAAIAEQRPIALVVNAEEGEPGVFKDRAMLCRRPRRFLEGLAIAAHVLQPSEVIIFINGEAEAALASLQMALAGSGDALPSAPRIVRGGGGYVLGEETTLLNALEGRKPVPRLRPPYPVEAGYFGMPTVVNNVETLANLSAIFREGADAFRTQGTADVPGTKLYSVSGRIQRPGLYELPMGTTVAELLRAAGGSVSGDVTAALVGGPSGGFLPPSEFERPLLPGMVHPTGAITGAGGIVFLDETSDIRQSALAMAAFNAEESCGKCTPCREGSPRAAEALMNGATGGLDDLLEVIQVASLCGLGQMAPGPIRSALHFWPELFS
ncbi:MAG TPA: NADH-ubiquinone oxidoreductase-F iron-sulfur binding region domain-containing protein [Tepidiformaceae bacterium]|nr:NADH-ubiquinone oxidoreductase-F iron-sulfur binding region domain-containing protein [Tepidiformaceae bacterium]